MRKLNKIITTAAMVAAILAGSTPKAAATGCPYTVGPLGRYIVPAQLLRCRCCRLIRAGYLDGPHRKATRSQRPAPRRG